MLGGAFAAFTAAASPSGPCAVRPVGQSVDLRIKTRQPFVLAEQDRCVTRRQFARRGRLARRGFSANAVQRAISRTYRPPIR